MGLDRLLGQACTFPMPHQGRELPVGHKTTLDALQLAGIGRHKEHIAPPQQLVGARGINDHARIDPTGHSKADTGWKVGLDQPGDDVDTGALRRDHQVHAHGTGHLGNATDRPLHLVRRGHHQIGQLVDDDHNIRQRLVPLGDQAPVVGVDVARPGAVQQPVAAFHLPGGPIEHTNHPLQLDHHRRPQMRDAIVGGQFNHLGIDHDELYLGRRPCTQQSGDNRIDTNTLARTGCPGDEQMRHGGQIDGHRATGHVLSQRDGQRPFDALEHLGFQHRAERHQRNIGIWHLDADDGTTGHWGFDTDGRCCQRQRQVVGQIRDLADLDLGPANAPVAVPFLQVARLDPKLGDRGSAVHLHHLGRDTKTGQRILNHPGSLPNLGVAQLLIHCTVQDILNRG